MYEYSKKSLCLPTKHGNTYCEIYGPKQCELTPSTVLDDDIEVLLMIHGLGSGVPHWDISDIPSSLSENNCVVVTFDMYSHGKSQVLNNKEIPHDVDLFLDQIHDIIHHSELPFRNKKKINMLGFSFGGFLLINYLLKYHKHSSKPCCAMGHCVPKLIFQSPWSGSLPTVILRPLLYVPGMLPLCRPTDMAYIQSFPALRHILLYADKQKTYAQCIKEFVELLEHYDQEAGVDGNTPVHDRQHTASEILFLSGSIEFYFTAIANELYQAIMKYYYEKYEGKNYKKTFLKPRKASAKKNKLPIELKEYEKRFQFYICRGADHMTFVYHTNRRIGQYYRDLYRDFLVPKYSVKEAGSTPVKAHKKEYPHPPIEEEKTDALSQHQDEEGEKASMIRSEASTVIVNPQHDS